MQLFEENMVYWTQRTEGYSKINEEELKTDQKAHWLAVLLEMLPKDRKDCKVLDIGTGPGFFAIILAEAGFSVTAVDCTASMLEQAKINAGIYEDRIDWVLSDAQALPFDKETFDAVVSRNLTWNLPCPADAYGEWLRVLKKGGVLLNFDANWYRFLYDEEERQGYEADRKRVLDLQMEDHYTCTDTDAMENIAKKMPLSRLLRPQWDIDVLQKQNVSRARVDLDVWERVWSETEKINYGSTPMFSVCVEK